MDPDKNKRKKKERKRNTKSQRNREVEIRHTTPNARAGARDANPSRASTSRSQTGRCTTGRHPSSGAGPTATPPGGAGTARRPLCHRCPLHQATIQSATAPARPPAPPPPPPPAAVARRPRRPLRTRRVDYRHARGAGRPRRARQRHPPPRRWGRSPRGSTGACGAATPSGTSSLVVLWGGEGGGRGASGPLWVARRAPCPPRAAPLLTLWPK